MMKKGIIGILAVLAALLLITGSVGAVSYTDDLGRTVELPDVVSHVIPSGELAETVLSSFDSSYLVSHSLKLGDTASTYLPESFASLPYTGSQFGSKRTMSDEEIMNLAKSINVDLILDIGAAKSGLGDTMDNVQKITGIPFIFVTQDKIDDIPVSYRKVGKLLGAEARGEELASYTQSVIDRCNEGMAKVGDNKKTMIYVTEVDGNSVHLIGSGEKSAYHTAVIDKVATNVAPQALSSSGAGDEYSLEDIMHLNPDYIIVKGSGSDGHDYYNAILSSPEWALLSAVQNGNVYEVPVDVPYNWIGQPPSSFNKTLSMIWLGKLFYPDVFTYDMKTEIQKFYKTMLNYDLSDEDYGKLTKYAVNPAKKTDASSPFPVLGILAGLGAAAVFYLRRR